MSNAEKLEELLRSDEALHMWTCKQNTCRQGEQVSRNTTTDLRILWLGH